MNAFYESTFLPSIEELALFHFGSIRELSLKTPPPKYWLAVSGGLDSMVLLHLFASWSKLHDLHTEVLHVNFGLRGEESEGDEAFVIEQAKMRGLACRVLRVPPGTQPAAGIQDWARQLRYKWFSEIAGSEDKVLLAHHEDDRVETILMRIMRGSGLAGLQGMKIMQGVYWRPLLELPQKVLQEIAQREKILHREDSSNAKLDYSRNRIRKLILPELEGMFPGAGRNLLELARAGQEWTRFHNKALAALDEPTTPEAWRDLGFYPASQWMLLKFREDHWAKDVGRAWLETVYQGLIEGANRVIQLDPGHQVRIKDGNLTLERKTQNSSPRWQQYERELTRTTMSALLSPGTRLEELNDASMEKQVSDPQNLLDPDLFEGSSKPQK